MNIAFIEPHLRVVGGVRRIMEVSSRLLSRGHAITIFTPYGDKCRWLPCSAKYLRLSELSKMAFDVAIFNLAEQYKHVLGANAKKKVFWVLAPEALYKNPAIPTLALSYPFYFMANSAFTAKYIMDRKKVSYPIPIIPGGINPLQFHVDDSIKKLYNVLYYGSARPWKGTDIIENALRSTVFRRNKMEGLGTPQDQMYKLYNSADVFVSACKTEGFSFPELEAMACGTPVVCTDSGGNREYIKNGVNALVVQRTPDGIRSGIQKLFTEKELRKSFREAGLKTAADPRYNWDNVVSQVENSLLEFLQKD